MSEVQKHYVLHGSHFVASFFSQAEIDSYLPPDGAFEVPERPSPDYQWLDGAWVHQPVDEQVGDPADYTLTARQLRLGLIRHGISLATVQSAISGIEDGQERDEAQVYWEFSTTIAWSHPMTQALMALAGISPEDAAAMWMVAKGYEN